MDKIILLVVLCLSGQAFACSTSGWSGWINEHNVTNQPFREEAQEGVMSTKGGDIESSTSLPKTFCAQGHGTLTKIECVGAVNGKNYTDAQDLINIAAITCDVTGGFKCRNRLTKLDQCIDYKVRFYCDCTSPVSGTGNTAAPTSVGVGGPNPTVSSSGGGGGGGGVTQAPGSNTGSASGQGTHGGSGMKGSGSGLGGSKRTTAAPGGNGAAANKALPDNGGSAITSVSFPIMLLFSFIAVLLLLRGI